MTIDARDPRRSAYTPSHMERGALRVRRHLIMGTTIRLAPAPRERSVE